MTVIGFVLLLELILAKALEPEVIFVEPNVVILQIKGNKNVNI